MIKDLGSTSFGLLIAFILPGLVALYGASYWLSPVGTLFHGFLTAESTVGLSILTILLSIAVGLYVTVVRSLLFEKVICRSSKLCAEDFAALESDGRLAAFRASVDEMYRYHQFWGGMFAVVPFAYASWLQTKCVEAVCAQAQGRRAHLGGTGALQFQRTIFSHSTREGLTPTIVDQDRADCSASGRDRKYALV